MGVPKGKGQKEKKITCILASLAVIKTCFHPLSTLSIFLSRRSSSVLQSLVVGYLGASTVVTLLPLSVSACFVARKASPSQSSGSSLTVPHSRLVCLVSSNSARPRSFVVQLFRPPISKSFHFLDEYTRILHLSGQTRILLSYTQSINQSINQPPYT